MTAADDVSDPRERELAELRAQVARLNERVTSSGRRRWGRGTGAVVLLVLAGLLLPVAASAVWANRLVSNTDRYVQTVAPLAQNPAMQAAITDRITTEIAQYVNVQDLTQQALNALTTNTTLNPTVASQLKTLSGPIASGVNSFVRTQVANIVASKQFAQAWNQANQVAHQQLVGVLTGKGTDGLSVKNGTVSLDLGPFIATVKSQLVTSGFSLASAIPAVDAQIVLFQSQNLTKAQTAFRVLNHVAWLLPLLVVALLVGGILLAPSWRLGVIGAGVAVGVAMIVALIALSIGRTVYLHELPTTVLPSDAAGSAFTIVTRFLRQSLLTLGFLGVVAVVVGLLAGPSRGAREVRRFWVGGLTRSNAWVRSIGVRTEPAATWVQHNALLLRILVAAAAVAVLLLWSYPTSRVAIWLTIAAIVGLAVIDFLRAPVPPGDEHDGAAAPEAPLPA